MGADAGLFKPLTWPEPTSPGRLERYYGVPELNSLTQGCTLDRVPIPCEIFHSLLNNDNVQIEYLVPDTVKEPPKPRQKDQPKKPVETALTVKKGDIRSFGVGVFTFESLVWNELEGGWDVTEEMFAVEHKLDMETLKKVIGDCVHELWPFYEMVDFKPTTSPGNRGGSRHDDSANGTLTIRDVQTGAVATVTNDPTPPPELLKDIEKVQKENPGVDIGGATDHTNPWWTYTVPEGGSDLQIRPGEKRYPELYLASGLDYVRIQLHETGSAINTISSHYHPGPYINPSDNGLYPNGHRDVGPAMEDCVGRNYYKQKGLKATY
jgi:hypothetical protein